METLTEKLKKILFEYEVGAPNALRMEIIEAVKERDRYCLSDVDMGIVSHYPNFEYIKKRMEESL